MTIYSKLAIFGSFETEYFFKNGSNNINLEGFSQSAAGCRKSKPIFFIFKYHVVYEIKPFGTRKHPEMRKN